ncbi:MAG: hypothetical protein CVU54_00185 [Deltaproteobacteria bacterium HGW-Deltaproteobacteria-12]|jgi:hypothetical protein|nr:MAG: hypothetical protein CVU54_00185 [Deltaproteobacteria bacterium HGW-Deltaproteobacteria-12]
MKKNHIVKDNDEAHLLKFLEKTKEGKYAKIEKSSLSFIRISESEDFAEPIPEECYYYSVS